MIPKGVGSNVAAPMVTRRALVRIFVESPRARETSGATPASHVSVGTHSHATDRSAFPPLSDRILHSNRTVRCCRRSVSLYDDRFRRAATCPQCHIRHPELASHVSPDVY
jgi:hypothetical protein